MHLKFDIESNKQCDLINILWPIFMTAKIFKIYQTTKNRDNKQTFDNIRQQTFDLLRSITMYQNYFFVTGNSFCHLNEQK